MRLKVSVFIAFCLAHASHGEAAPQQEMVLAGGALQLCSSLSPGQCKEHALPTFSAARTSSRYRIDAEGIALALDESLWRTSPQFVRPALAALLASAREKLGDRLLQARELREHLAGLCLTANRDEDLQVTSCRDGDNAPWKLLLDGEQEAVLSALQQPQIDQSGIRRLERASLRASRNQAGVQVIEAFVAAAARRSEGPPRIAFVTASALDPFDAVDFYRDLFREAGAEAEWWPLDAALHAALVGKAGCDALPELRLKYLRLAGRERVYPDLVAEQLQACRDLGASPPLPQRVQGVFFAGGDQWRIRQVFFTRDDRPNAWLLALRAAFESGSLVVGGTSAGSAVQSGIAMLGNGQPLRALLHPAHASSPPEPGCLRAGRCAEGLHEDDLTYWPAGGLALWPDLVIDTHFSERAREVRLLRLLHQGGARFGLGIDETSALHLRSRGTGEWHAKALGEHGAWLFDAGDAGLHCTADGTEISAQVLYLPSGGKARINAKGIAHVDAETGTRNARRPAPVVDPIEGGALRAAIAGLREGDSVRGRVREAERRADVVLQRESEATLLRIRTRTRPPTGCL